MCGISGWLLESAPNNQMQASAQKMLEVQKHRGPDHTGKFHNQDQTLFLGHNRLSIIDLSQQGNQPMITESGDVMVMNGEIYNYREVRRELVALGHNFSSRSDSEVLLKSFVEWGTDCLSKLRGMFAFAFWHENTQCLHLVRDPTGIKPLYYWHKPNSNDVVFASEVRTLFEISGFDRSVNRQALGQYIEFGYTFDKIQTISNDVFKIPPGHRLEITRDQRPNLIEYYSPPTLGQESLRTYADTQTMLYQELQTVIQEHMVADVPVGLLLSGGLDSSLIAAIASQHEKIHTLSMGFSDSQTDERPFAKLVSDHIGSKHTEFLITPENILDGLHQTAASFDDVFDDWGLVSTNILYKFIRQQGIKVALVGEGSDELFGGYPIYRASLGIDDVPSEWDIFKLYRRYNGRRYGNQYRRFRRTFKQQLERSDDNFFAAIRRFEMLNRMPNNYVMKVDKASMSQSVEARTPFLDSRIADIAYQVPRDFLISENNEKILLKDIARRYKLLPNTIINRTKYGAPIATNWLDDSGEFRGFAQDNILSNDSWVDELGLRRPMELYFHKHQTGYRFPRSISLFRNLAWRILILNLWSESVGVTS